MKKVTWILMELPCYLMSQLDSSLVQIDTKFHDFSMSFTHLFVVHTKRWHGFWTSSSHGISMAFAKKMKGCSLNLVLYLTKLPRSKSIKLMSHFLGIPGIPQLLNMVLAVFYNLMTAVWISLTITVLQDVEHPALKYRLVHSPNKS